MKYVPSPTETQGSISGEYTVTGKGHGAGRSMPGFGCVRACLCCGHVCPRISRGGLLNAGILGSVQWRLPGWQDLQWEQKNMSGRALALQIGSEMAPRPFTGRVN